MPLDKVKECMGDPEADADNPVLKKEQELQVHFFSPWFNLSAENQCLKTFLLPFLTIKIGS